MEQFDTAEAASATKGRAGFLKAGAWSSAERGGRQLATLLLGFVLAAILGPEAFGVVSMGLVYIALVEVIQRQGLTSAIVQRKDLDRAHANAAFWMVIGLSALLTLASMLLAGWWAGINNLPELQNIIIALSSVLLLQALSVVPGALLMRNMQYRSLAIRSTSSVLVGGAVGIAAALAGWGPWALVLQQIITAAWATAVLWWASGWTPSLSFSKSAAKDLLGFSGGSALSGLGLYVNTQADTLLSGIFLGPLVVGLLRFSARLSDTLLSVTVRSAATLGLSDLSPMQSKPREFDRRLARLSRTSGAVALPAYGVLFGVAEPLLGLLGEEWLPAAGALRWLAAYGAVRVWVGLVGVVLLARGRPYVQAIFTWGTGIAGIGFFLVAVWLSEGMAAGDQAAYVAASRAVGFGAVLLVASWLVMRLVLGIRARVWPLPYAPGTFAMLIAAPVTLLMADLTAAMPAVVGVALTGGVGLVVGLSAVALIDPTARGLVMGKLGRRVGKGDQ